MTEQELEIWTRFACAAVTGELSSQSEDVGTYRPEKDGVYLGRNAAIYADAMLAEWRKRKAEVETGQ